MFRSEQADPELYYTVIAEDAVAQVAAYCELSGQTVVDCSLPRLAGLAMQALGDEVRELWEP